MCWYDSFLRTLSALSLCTLVVLVPSADADAKRGGGKNQPPVAFDSTAPSIPEDGSAVVELLYTDPNGDLADSCSVITYSLQFNGRCGCDAAGVCTIEVQGPPDEDGGGTFDFTVIAARKTSNTATVTVDFIPVNDAPTVTSFTHPPFPENTEELITLPHADPDDIAQFCTVSDLENVTESTACACIADVCTVGVTGVLNHTGPASFQFTISDGALDSLPATASLAVGIGSVAMRVPSEGDLFGFSVAAFGNRFVAGAPGESDPATDAGAAYVYADPNSDGDWSDRELEARLSASDAQAGDYFGSVVAMADDVVVVLEDTESWGPFLPNRLHVFVDQRGDGNWVERNVLDRPQFAGHWGGGIWSGPGFDSLDIDGARIVAGAFQDSTNLDFGGAVYIYDDPGSDKDWADANVTRLEASDAQESAGYGLSVAIDGDVLVVGAPGHDSKVKGPLKRNAGAVYIYRKIGTGWVEEARLSASDTAQWLSFGATVDVEGDTVVVSAENEDEQGKIYVIRYVGGEWVEDTSFQIFASNGDPNDRFGSGGMQLVDNKIFVGTPFEDGALGVPFANDWTGSGALYIIEDPDSNNDWSNAVEYYLKPAFAPDLAGETRDYFASSFAVANDTVVVGAFGEDGDGALPPNDDLRSSGAVYLFVDPNGDGAWADWIEELYAK